MVERDTYFDAIVIGLGQTGLSCVRFLAAQGLSLAVADTRPQPPGLNTLREQYPGIPVYLGRFDAALLCRAGRLILSPGVPQQDPAIQAAVGRGIELAGDIELFARHVTAPVIAVTGSNGKTTVASMTAAMIAAAGRQVRLGGNIGTPALDLLAEPVPDFYVLELSSFQLETVQSLQPAVAVVLNVSSDHMDRYADLAAYAAAKHRIYRGAGVMILNRDDPAAQGVRQQGSACIPFSAVGPPEQDGFGIRVRAGEEWLARGSEALLPVRELALPGRHNLANALAALALGTAAGLPEAAMLEVLRTFSALPHRCQHVARIGGVDWIDDSKATNVGAACAAIHGLGGADNLVLIAGGDGKAADFSALADAVRGRVHSVILIGRDAQRIADALQGEAAVLFATGMEAAVKTAARSARPGDTVLLSPACASLDMFRDYRERGAAFAAAVRALDTGGEEA